MADTPLAASPAHSPLVILADGEATTTSLAVAEFFGKQHRHVLRDIRNLIDQMGPGDHSPKFGQMIRLVKTGKGASRAEHYFSLNFDAFVLLTMGYDGPKALAIKMAYLGEFNAMRSRLQGAAVAPLIAQRDHLQLRLDSSTAELATLKAQAGQHLGQLLAAKDEVIAAQARQVAAQDGQIKLLGRVDNLQRRMSGREATRTIIDMERAGEPRELIALRTGRSPTHIRVALFKARAAGVLPPLVEGNFAANLVASARTLQAAQATAQSQLDLGAHHG